MSEGLLNALRHLATTTGVATSGPRPEVYFFTTVHSRCPRVLPPRSVVFVLDVIPLIMPDFFPKGARRWREDYGPKARQAAVVLGISRAGLEDSIRHLGLNRERTGVVHCGITPLPPPAARSTPEVPHFCFLGTPDPNKNLSVVLKALAMESCAGFELHLIGAGHESLLPLIGELGLGARVKLLGRLDDAVTAASLRGATALVVPSFYEGFGLPPFEAALLGTPSICSRRPAMNELLEGAALFCEPDRPDEWAAAMVRLAEEPELRDRLAQNGRRRAEAMSWDNAARSLLPYFARAAQPD